MSNSEQYNIDLNYYYMNTINNYINTVNNSINYLNRSNVIISNMYNNLNYYYYWNYWNNTINNNYNNSNNSNNNNNSNNYISLENNRRRRLNPQLNTPENNSEEAENNSEQAENNNEEVENNNEEAENNNEEEERVNNYYRELSRQNLTNAIVRNIRKLKYRDLSNPIDTVCAITLEEFQPDDDIGLIEHCNHIFKYDSLLNWLIRHQTCPNCRHSILENANLIRYIDTELNERLYLTNRQFRRYLIRRILRIFRNNNSLGSNNLLSVNFR